MVKSDESSGENHELRRVKDERYVLEEVEDWTDIQEDMLREYTFGQNTEGVMYGSREQD